MYYAIFDNNLGSDSISYYFRNPKKFITCFKPELVVDCLEKINKEVNNGNYACGYLSYEASEAFGFKTKYDFCHDLPVLCFGIFRERESVNAEQVEALLCERSVGAEGYLIGVETDTSENKYLQSIEDIHRQLRRGNSYQVNFTTRFSGRLGGDPQALYSRLRKAQRVEYGAFLNFPKNRILSRSPELFFKKIANKIVTKPMKGTAARSQKGSSDDQRVIENLSNDTKQRAENVMIVDLLRNDLSQIAKAGSVNVENLFEVETYETVHQMTSTISCTIKEDSSSIVELMMSLFPCGSITGAPKKRTCEIIADLEESPRGVYTGAIGMLEPNGDMCFNVAIRTLTVDDNRNFCFGVGGGIVMDSKPKDEYAECKIKSRFIFENQPDFNLIETIRWSKGMGFVNLESHLSRLTRSSGSLGFSPPPKDLVERLEKAVLGKQGTKKIRLEYTREGLVEIECSDFLEFPTKKKKVVLSPFRILSDDFLRQHKTTNRVLLDEERARYQKKLDVYDVLFANDQDNLTEASYHSLFLRFGSVFHTPLLDCGVLEGIGRANFIEQAERRVVERKISIQELFEADEVLLVSSVRGRNSVELLQDVR